MAAETGTNQKRDILQQQLKDILECNVCFNVPETAPIYQCINGHLLCKDCNKKLTSCPCCRELLSNVRSLVAEKLLDVIPTGCKFKKYGCDVSLPRADLPTHSKVCQYREITCPRKSCNQLVCLTQLAEHFQKHTAPFTTQEDVKPLGESSPFSIRLTGGTLSTENNWYCGLLFNGEYFILQAQLIKDPSKDSGHWYIWMYAGLRSDECPKFVCDLKISEEGSGEIVSKDGPVVSLDMERVQV